MSDVKKKSEEQNDAESEVQRFEDRLGPFVLAAETTPMAKVLADPRGSDYPMIFANDSFLALPGYERQWVLGRASNVWNLAE